MTRACLPVAADLPEAGWTALCGILELAPEEVLNTTLLARSEKSTVYRVDIRGGSSHVLKRHLAVRAAAEAAVYRDVLDPLALTPGGCLGLFLEQDAGAAWLAMDDAGDVRAEAGAARDGHLAAEWLTIAHLTTAEAHPPATVARRDAGFYRPVLQTCLDRMEAQLDGDELYPGADTVIGSLLAGLSRVEAEWAVVEETCAAFPAVLVHGDFVPKNLAAMGSVAAALWPLDWETAGWGSPGPDLAELANAWPEAIDTYAAAMRRAWPRLRGSHLSDLIAVGRVLRLIVATEWATDGLAFRGWSTIFGRLGTYVSWLDAALATRPWS